MIMQFGEIDINNYDIPFCEEMLKACDTDLENFKKRSEQMIAIQASMRSMNVEEYKESYVKSIEDVKNKLKERIKELGGNV